MYKNRDILSGCFKTAIQELKLLEEQQKENRCKNKQDLSVFDRGIPSKAAADPIAPSIHVLLLSDRLDFTIEGISGVSRMLAIALGADFVGCNVTATVFQPSNQIGEEVKAYSKELKVKLLSLSEDECLIAPSLDPVRLYLELSTTPHKFAHRFSLDGRDTYTHIIGHSPITGKLAIYLHEEMFPTAKLILFFHIIPEELRWLASESDFACQSDEEHLKMAQKADVVYSVSPKNHEYFECLFLKSKSKVSIDHRLFIPIVAKPVC